MDEGQKSEKTGSKGNLAFIVLGIVVAIGISAALCIFCFSTINLIATEQTPVCENFSPIINSIVPIYSTEDGTAVKGDFFLGCGHIKTYTVYLFYTGDDTHGFQRQMIDSSNVRIFRDAESPYMVKKMIYGMEPMYPAGAVCQPKNIVELHILKDTLIKDI